MRKPLAFDPHASIDLHVHSTASDGTLTPSEILATAVQLGLRAIAITDHDTLAGTAAAIATGVPSQLDFLTGIEISAAAPPGYDMGGSVHILGYGVDLDDSAMHSLLNVLKTARENRSPRIIQRLKRLGMDLTMDELAPFVGDATPGRPHIAQLMVHKGMVDSIEAAFDRFLAKNQPAYVEKSRVPMADAIGAINHAGGIAVLAHPYLNGPADPARFETFLLVLQSMGLKGIEAYYPDHPPAAVAEYCRLARKHDLLISGGTDFHGQVNPGVRMGVGRGDFHVPYSIYQLLAVQLAKGR